MDRRKKGSGQITFVDEPNRKSKWRATVTDSRGKRKTRYFRTEKEAKAFLRDVNADANKLRSIMESGVTFSAFTPVFLSEKEQSGMKERSFETLRANVNRVEPYIGRTLLRDIDSDMVQQLVYDLAAKGYSTSILNKSKMAVFAVLKMAAAKHFLDTVPVLDVTIPQQHKKKDTDKEAKNNWLRDNELMAYEAECKRTYIPGRYTKYAGQELMVHTAGYKLLFLLHTGLRLGEALALTWADYDDNSKTIIVNKNVVYAQGGKITQTTKTEAGERVIILNRQAAADLAELRKQFDVQSGLIEEKKKDALRRAEAEYSGISLKAEKKRIREEFDAIQREHKYICGSSTYPYGSSGHGSTNQTHSKICRAIGLTHNVTTHGLRHTYVTHFYIKHCNDPDFDLAHFSKSIGHASVRTTMEIYTHLDLVQNRYIPRTLNDLKDF